MSKLVALCLAAAFSSAAFSPVHAQSYPTKPVRWIVPSAPGGAFDLLTRAFMPHVSTGLGQPLIVDNRAAVSGIAGVESVAKAAPDGYTILTAGNPQMVFNRHMHAKLPYDPQKDFEPVSLMADLHFALWVHTSVPASTLQELIAYGKANPGKLNYGTGGVGQAFHLAMELLKMRTGFDMVHIPYKGNGPALQDFFSGRVESMFYPPTGQLLAQMKDGKIRPIAAATDKRMQVLPNTPTFGEAGVPGLDRDVMGWVGVFAPARTPGDVVARLNRELVRVANLPELAKVYNTMNIVKSTSTPQSMAQQLDREIKLWGPVIRKLNIQLE